MSELLNDLDILLAKPQTENEAIQLCAWAAQVRSRISRGDLLLGILSIYEINKIPLAYEMAAKCGKGDAWLLLSNWYLYPEWGDCKVEQAEIAISHAIELGVNRAAFQLAKLVWYFKRESATENEKASIFEFLSHGLKLNPEDADFLYLLGLLTCAGFGTKASPKIARELHELASNLGNSDAMFELSLYNFQGIGTKKDHKKALSLCFAAANVGQVRAMYNLGAFYATGKYLKKNSGEALRWYERSAEGGNTSGMIAAAVMYAAGDGTERNDDLAIEWLNQAEIRGIDISRIRAQLGLDLRNRPKSDNSELSSD